LSWKNRFAGKGAEGFSSNRMALKSKHMVFMWLLLFPVTPGALSQTHEIQGQLSGWMTAKRNQSSEAQIGFRYIPGLSINKTIAGDYSVDTELSLNAYGFGTIHPSDDFENDAEIKPYRLWLRLSSSQFEVRGGLQKINFGSAALLRPLMWFDRIDPRDPLGLTDGVYGLLGRYYFLNNANVWLWGLYGNDDKKDWEGICSNKKRWEYGGRLQLPLFNGEMAASYHHRQIDPRTQGVRPFLSSTNNIPEDRLGLDGKWDIGVGLWFEGVLIRQGLDISRLRYQRFSNVGLDYTFDFGNGLNFTGEHFTFGISENAFASGEDTSISALSSNYPVGLLDNLTAMVYYDWDNRDWYRYVNWQRRYDTWSLYFIGFWNPDRLQIHQARQENSLFDGKGVQLMVVFNH